MYRDKVAFGVGTGRCGTKFIAELLSLHNSVNAVHERNPLNETFHRYCKWNKLKVDDLGFINCKIREIDDDLNKYSFSFESSAHLAFSIQELYQAFECKFVLFLRSPLDMIKSYAKKGVYANSIVRSNHNQPVGNQDNDKFHQFLGRIVPNGQEDFEKWNELSQYGKLAWWWKTINSSILEQLSQIPRDKWMIQRIEEFDYVQYMELMNFLNIHDRISEKKFYKLSKKRPNSFQHIKINTSWINKDMEALEDLTPLAERLGYSLPRITIDELNK